MNRKRETKATQKEKVGRQLGRVGSRNTDSGRGESDSTLGSVARGQRERWLEEAVHNEPVVNDCLTEMSRNKNKERHEDREDAEDTAQQPPGAKAASGGAGDMMAWMQMWMQESKRKEDEWREETQRKEEAWRVEMRLQRKDAREREDRAKGREERLLEKMQAQIEASSRPVTVKTRKESLNLPRLMAESSLDTFISTFEAQLNMATVPESDWKLKLIGQLDKVHRVQVSD